MTRLGAVAGHRSAEVGGGREIGFRKIEISKKPASPAPADQAAAVRSERDWQPQLRPLISIMTDLVGIPPRPALARATVGR